MITNKLKLMIGALVIGAVAVITAATTIQSSNLNTPTVAEVGAFKGSNSYCSWENYGVDISQPNYPGHIDNPPNDDCDGGVKVYLPKSRNGLKFSSSSASGTYTYTLTSAYNRVYVWAAGWSGDTSSLSINGVSVNIAPNTLVAGSLNVDVYYDRYAFTLPEATTEFIFTATKRLVIGGVAWYKDIDLSNDIVAMNGPEALEEPEQSSMESIISSEETSDSSPSTKKVVNWTPVDLGLNDTADVSSIVIGYTTITLEKGSGSTHPRYWAADHTLRVYANNTATITSTKPIKSIVSSPSIDWVIDGSTFTLPKTNITSITITYIND